VGSELTNVVTDKLIGQTRKAMLVTIMNLKVKRTTIYSNGFEIHRLAHLK
jgi:hypothetical protein